MTLTSPDRTSRPWTFAAISGVATYVLSLVIFLQRESTRTDASVAGELVIPALIGSVAGGFLGSVTQGWWRLFTPWLAPPLVAAIVVALTQGKELVDEAGDRRAAEREYARSHVVVKDSVLGWRRVDDPTARQHAEGMAEQLAEREPNSTHVWGSYAKGADRMGFVGINTGEGGLQTELEQSPREALINFMAGAGVSDPRPIKTSIEGIELACAELDASTVTCGWADLTSIGTAAWRGDGVDIDEAAGRTEDFLGELRVVDELPD